MSATEIGLRSVGTAAGHSTTPSRPYRMLRNNGTKNVTADAEPTQFAPDAKISVLPSDRGTALAGQFELLQLWEGYVVSATADTMRCRLVDKTVEENPDEEVVIPLKELDPTERPLAKPGAVFYWSIRYADHGRGRVKESLFRFRRIPPVKKQQVEQAKRRAEYLENLFRVD